MKHALLKNIILMSFAILWGTAQAVDESFSFAEVFEISSNKVARCLIVESTMGAKQRYFCMYGIYNNNQLTLTNRDNTGDGKILVGATFSAYDASLGVKIKSWLGSELDIEYDLILVMTKIITAPNLKIGNAADLAKLEKKFEVNRHILHYELSSDARKFFTDKKNQSELYQFARAVHVSLPVYFQASNQLESTRTTLTTQNEEIGQLNAKLEQSHAFIQETQTAQEYSRMIIVILLVALVVAIIFIFTLFIFKRRKVSTLNDEKTSFDDKKRSETKSTESVQNLKPVQNLNTKLGSQQSCPFLDNLQPLIYGELQRLSALIGLGSKTSASQQLSTQFNPLIEKITGQKLSSKNNLKQVFVEVEKKLAKLNHSEKNVEGLLREFNRLLQPKEVKITSANIHTDLSEIVGKLQNENEVGSRFLALTTKEETKSFFKDDNVPQVVRDYLKMLEIREANENELERVYQAWKNFSGESRTTTTLVKNLEQFFDTVYDTFTILKLPADISVYDKAAQLVTLYNEVGQREGIYEGLLFEHFYLPKPDKQKTIAQLSNWQEKIIHQQDIRAWLKYDLIGEMIACKKAVADIRNKDDAELNQCLKALYIDDIMDRFENLKKGYFSSDIKLYNGFAQKLHKIFRAAALLQTYYPNHEDLKVLEAHLRVITAMLRAVFVGLAELNIQFSEPALLAAAPTGCQEKYQPDPLLTQLRTVKDRVKQQLDKQDNQQFIVDIETYGISDQFAKCDMVVIVYNPSAWE